MKYLELMKGYFSASINYIVLVKKWARIPGKLERLLGCSHR
jgi:hypothetical protein